MATDFPATGLDTFSDVVTGGTVLAATTNNMQDPIEAIEIKVGVDGSAVVTSLDYLLKNSSSTTPGHLHTTLGTITTGVWTGTTIAVANGGTGATTASAARTALGLGTASLEDYEEGTWTPTIEQTGGGGFDGGYSYQFGDYVKIGKVVTASCWVRVAGSSGGSGTVSVLGLPFAKNQNDYQHVGVIGYNDALALNCVRGWVNASKFTIVDTGRTGGNYSGAVAGGELCFTVIYTTDG